MSQRFVQQKKKNKKTRGKIGYMNIGGGGGKLRLKRKKNTPEKRDFSRGVQL